MVLPGCEDDPQSGEVHAQIELARMHESGFGVTLSHRKAVKWFRKAADHGDAEAQHELVASS
jgi:TPR repeat protein